MLELRLPELGENVETALVAQVLVKPGDRVRRDQPVLEVETEKATLEVPAVDDGTVSEVLVRVGDKIRVGAGILRFEPTTAPELASPTPPVAEQATLAPAPAEPSAPEPVSGRAGSAVLAFPTSALRRRPEIGPTVPAAPSVRALARELGLDILQVPGSGPHGRISRDDVKAHAKRLLVGVAAGAPAAALAVALPDFSAWGEVETEPLSGLRRATAKAMASAWAQVPHVTQFDHADVTQLDELRQRFNKREEARGRKLTLTAIVIKLVASALREVPAVQREPRSGPRGRRAQEVRARRRRGGHRARFARPRAPRREHEGAAADRRRAGPALRARARASKLTPDEMAGASFTVSNLGGLGTTYFSPIVAWPQVAILGVGRAEMRPVWVDAKFEPRLVLPLSVSYDHRVIDGADAARFARWIAEALEQPLLLLVAE